MLETPTDLLEGVRGGVGWVVGVSATIGGGVMTLLGLRRKRVEAIVDEQLQKCTQFVRTDVHQAQDERVTEILKRIEERVNDTGEQVKNLGDKVDQLQVDVARLQGAEEQRQVRPALVSVADPRLSIRKD